MVGRAAATLLPAGLLLKSGVAVVVWEEVEGWNCSGPAAVTSDAAAVVVVVAKADAGNGCCANIDTAGGAAAPVETTGPGLLLSLLLLPGLLWGPGRLPARHGVCECCCSRCCWCSWWLSWCCCWCSCACRSSLASRTLRHPVRLSKTTLRGLSLNDSSAASSHAASAPV